MLESKRKVLESFVVRGISGEIRYGVRWDANAGMEELDKNRWEISFSSVLAINFADVFFKARRAFGTDAFYW